MSNAPTDQPNERDERDAAQRAAERIGREVLKQAFAYASGGGEHPTAWMGAIIREEIAKDHDSLRTEKCVHNRPEYWTNLLKNLSRMTAENERLKEELAAERDGQARYRKEIGWQVSKMQIELDEESTALQSANARITQLTTLLDKALGTPCEQIRLKESSERLFNALLKASTQITCTQSCQYRRNCICGAEDLIKEITEALDLCKSIK